jgi:hypothetical protein
VISRRQRAMGLVPKFDEWTEIVVARAVAARARVFMAVLPWSWAASTAELEVEHGATSKAAARGARSRSFVARRPSGDLLLSAKYLL